MINHQLTTTQWLELPIEVRLRLKEIFGIPRSEGTLVQDNKVVSDGYNHRDLSVVTIGAMQGYLKVTEGDFYQLFDAVITQIRDEIAMHTEKIVPESPVKTVQSEELFIEHNGKTYKLTEVDGTPKPMALPAPAMAQPQVPAKAKRTRGPNKVKVAK